MWFCLVTTEVRNEAFGAQAFQAEKVHSPNLLKKKCIGEVVGIGCLIIFHLSKLWKAKFFILCDVIFLVRLTEKFDIDHWLLGVKWLSLKRSDDKDLREADFTLSYWTKSNDRAILRRMRANSDGHVCATLPWLSVTTWWCLFIRFI